MCKTPKDKSAQIAAQQEAERQARITSGTAEIDKTFGGFNDEYYGGITGAYKDHYTPLLEEQYGDAKKNMYLNPMGGSTDSSAFGQQLAKLETEHQRQLTDINNRSLSEAQTSRGNVAQNRQSLLSQLNAGAGVSQVAGLAAEQAKSLNAAPVYSALGDVFSQFSGQAVNAANAGVFNSPTAKNNNALNFGGGNKTAATYVR